VCAVSGKGQIVSQSQRTSELLTKFFSNSNKLSDRQIFTSDTPYHRPLAFVFHGLRYDGAEIVGSDEANAGTIGAIEYNRAAVGEVKLRLEGMNVFGRLVRACEVIYKHAGLEETVFQNLVAFPTRQQRSAVCSALAGDEPSHLC
jgi:hypothetical protein